MADERPTFLVVLDGTAECRKALRFAALRALHTGAGVKLLHVIKPVGFLQWGGVQRAMDAEVEDEAKAMLAAEAAVVAELLGETPETLLRRGKPTEEVRRLVDEDRGIRSLVLAAAPQGRPGPLVDYFSGQEAGAMPCLVMIVPGGIDDAALDRLT
jgi:nucleotide-binding universal stress UspA family protein